MAHEHCVFGIAYARIVVLSPRIMAAQALISWTGAGAQQRGIVRRTGRHNPTAGAKSRSYPCAAVVRASNIIAVIIDHNDGTSAGGRIP